DAIATYTPASNYNGPDAFTFRVTQGALTSPLATVSIAVAAANDPPVATPQTVEINPVSTGAFADIVLKGTDPENSPLTFAIVTQPSRGNQTGKPPHSRYTCRTAPERKVYGEAADRAVGDRQLHLPRE